MKLNKRIKSSLIQTFLFNVVLLIGIGIFIFLYIWPSFNQIQENKATLASNYEKLSSIEKTGITLEDFKELSQKSSLTPYIKELIKTTWDDFYTRNFNNKLEWNFASFLMKKQEEVSSQQKLSVLEQRNKPIDILLPTYVTDSSEDWITDFEFINYVETLLYSFNLVSENSIWIWELKKVEDIDVSTNNKDNLDSNMFYIPLSLDITGQKGNIIDFIYYLENVWSISLRDDNIEVYSDKELSNNIAWNVLTEDYNIYENQLSDIESISLPSYIDSSSDQVSGLFTDFIKTTQTRQRFSIEIDLRFYVQWLPDYKIKTYVNSVVQMHTDLLSESKRSLKTVLDNAWSVSTSELRAKNAIKSLSNILVLMQADIQQLKSANSGKDQDLVQIYNEAQEYQQRLSKIEQVLQDSMIELTNKK